MSRLSWHNRLRAGALAVLSACTGFLAQAEPVILAAASTSRALGAALEESGLSAVTSFAASGVLARQIEQGAPADLYLSANSKWMAHLVKTGAIAKSDVSVLMSNRLVLIAPQDAAAWDAADLGNRLKGEVFAMADPDAAPVGAYGKAALEQLGLWADVAPHFVPMRNTLATVAAVASGDAQLGLVYASDAIGHPVDVLLDIPTESHPAIAYLIAPVSQGASAPDAHALLAFLHSASGQAVLAAHGFVVGQK